MKRLEGICPAIVTPFDHAGGFDPAAMRRIVQHQLTAGVHGFYVCGGTGEGLLLSADERRAVLETVLDEVDDRAVVIAHVGAFHTADTLALARHASDAGADAIAAMPPAYFYKLDSLALERYYWAVAQVSRVPILIYNIPARTGVSVTPEVLDRMLKIDNIVGMKDSSGNIYQIGLFFSGGKRPVIFNGEDTVLLAGLLAGACGGIGATYNMMPDLFVKLWQSFQQKDLETAAKTQLRINELIDALLVVNLFAGLKQTMAWMELECGEPRTPIRPLTEEETIRLRTSLESAGFFEGV